MKTSFRFLRAAAALSAFAACASVPAAQPSAGDVAKVRTAASLFDGALASGDLGVFYQALPAEWKASLSDVAKTVAAGADPELWGELQSAALQVFATAVRKSDLIAELAADSSVPGASGFSPEERRALVVKYGSKLGAIAKAADPKKIAEGGLGAVLAAAPLTMKGVTDSVSAVAPSSGIEVVPQADGSIVVTGSRFLQGTGGGLKFVKAGGAWVPEPVAKAFEGSSGWAASAAAEGVPVLPPETKAQIKSVAAMVKGAARQASSAQTKEQFRTSVMQALFPLMMLGGSFGGGAGGGAGLVPGLGL
ncbi:MAG: hypothetical protein IJ678_01070 [Kiritimatiellae bacterium]|nr:hypothetical protein [Kiritimatiellia bacterium]